MQHFVELVKKFRVILDNSSAGERQRVTTRTLQQYRNQTPPMEGSPIVAVAQRGDLGR